MAIRAAAFFLASTMLAGAAWSMDDEQAAQAAKTRQSVLTVIRRNLFPWPAWSRSESLMMLNSSASMLKD